MKYEFRDFFSFIDEERSQSSGYQLNKNEIFSFVTYVHLWPQRYVLCLFFCTVDGQMIKDFKE